ncbi:MAG TPA: aspartate carbamoyltransferase catalytic subunit [Xanthomonadales bacterium]|nr:aspartate carbamoyltransferase catalytic subunit [Xanthomonadales bacterium]
MSGPLQHFTHIDDCSTEQLRELLQLALKVAADPGHYHGSLSDQLLINLFYEPSTRTRVSFETAAKRLGMHVVNVGASGSSIEKGETLHDTFYTLQAMQPDFVVIRHPQEGTATDLASRAEPGTHVINAGDGTAAHPTQALLDAITLQQHFGDLSRLTIVMAGDIRHSRVARSSLALLRRLGVREIRLAAPADFLPGEQTIAHDRVFNDFDAALKGANVIMMLRIQKERISGLNIPAAADYHRDWGLTQQRLALAAPDCRVLHPGPINREVEIASEVADGPQSLIRQQVRNGLHTRMALLLALAGERSGHQ